MLPVLTTFLNVIKELLYLFGSMLHTSHTGVFPGQLDQCSQAKQLSSLSLAHGLLHTLEYINIIIKLTGQQKTAQGKAC